MTPDPRFPNAPDDSWVSEEGWLIIGDEAWTEDDWQLELAPPRFRESGTPKGWTGGWADDPNEEPAA